jgi:hypothetical protein
MIRSTKTTLKFARIGKQNNLERFLEEYSRVVRVFVEKLWPMDTIPGLLPKDVTGSVPSWLSARMMQAAGKQASGIVRGARKKQDKRAWMINKLHEEGKHRKARKLQRIYDEISITLPDLERVEPQLDQRFIKIDLQNSTSFDGWLTIGSIGDKLKLVLPFKKTTHFNKMLGKGQLKPSIRLCRDSVSFSFEIPDPVPTSVGVTIGIDIGQKTMLSCSNGVVSKPDKHGHDLATISEKLSRKKKGSKAFERAQDHRKNYVNWSINQLDLSGVRQVNIERIRNLRKGCASSRALSHWTYTEIFGKLESYCLEWSVSVERVNPTYTSQRCSVCGWTRKSNRKGKLFKCGRCSHEQDADLNASRNIALPLPPIWKKQRLQQLNRKGFWWFAEGQEPIVPAVHKADLVIS